MSTKKVAPAPTHARERAKVVKTRDGFKVIEGSLTVFQDPRKEAAEKFAAVENNRLAKNAKNRAKYKSKLWEVRLYVKPGDDKIKARLLAQEDINAYLKKLVEADIDGAEQPKKDGSSVIHGIRDGLLAKCASFTWSNESDGRHYVVELAEGWEFVDRNGEKMSGGDFSTVYNCEDFLLQSTPKKGRK